MNQNRVPWWMTTIIIICMLPAVAYLVMLMHSTTAQIGDGEKPFLWLYPVYTLACGFLAWQSYGRRTYMTWILLVLMLMTHGAMLLLI